MQKLGEVYRDGRGVPADPVTGDMWFAIAAKMGATDSQNSLAALKPRLTQGQVGMAEARANTWAVEHQEAMQQRPGQYVYQGWTAVERGPQPTRGPSTPDERAYALLLTQHLEQDPLSLDASAARAWLGVWWEEIPDIMVRPCNLVDAPNHEPYPYEKEVYEQVTYSEGAYILENPGKTTDWDAAFLAGMSGALRAYQAILRQKPDAKSAFFDDLLQQQSSAHGQLAATVRALVKERCK
jgi:hypothetical protein